MHTKYKGSSLRRGALKDLLPKKSFTRSSSHKISREIFLSRKSFGKSFFHRRVSEDHLPKEELLEELLKEDP